MLQALRQPGDGLLHLPDFVFGEIVEALVGQAAHFLLVAQFGVFLLQLGADEAADHVRQVLQPPVHVLRKLFHLFGAEPGLLEGVLQVLEFLLDVSETHHLGQRVGELAFLERALDVLQIGALGRFLEHFFELAGVVRE